MTTDSTPDLCCTHGQELVQRIERVVELMEEVHAAHVGKLAAGGIGNAPSGPVIGGTGCVIPIDPQALAEAVAEGTIAELDRQGRLRF